MYGGTLVDGNSVLPGFINRNSPQLTLAFALSSDSVDVTTLLAQSGNPNIKGLDDYVAAVYAAANVIAARPANASVGSNATAIAADSTLQFILKAQSVSGVRVGSAAAVCH